MNVSVYLKKSMIAFLESSMRAPSGGLTGWMARNLMRSANPASTQVGIRRLQLQETDCFVELGAGEGVGLKTIMAGGDDIVVPKRIHLVEISQDFRNSLTAAVSELDADKAKVVEIHENDCKRMDFLSDNSVDKLFAMNVVYFLDPLPDYLKEFHRVLKAKTGTVVFGCKFKAVPEKGTSTVFVNVEEEDVTRMMKEAGFEVTSEMVEVSKDERMKNYLEIKGIKRG